VCFLNWLNLQHDQPLLNKKIILPFGLIILFSLQWYHICILGHCESVSGIISGDDLSQTLAFKCDRNGHYT
jgi:hypothetical protein